MPLRFPAAAPEAYHFPLTIGHLLDSAMLSAADQEIIYRDKHRYTYRGFHDRIGRLASFRLQPPLVSTSSSSNRTRECR